ncbi:MAG: hypothetical protein LUF30_05270 [Lachnospiraceae bacterium]|nr:hypothetical protein [Lachnospiraceae bacterium]
MPYRSYAINYYTEDGAYAVINYWEKNMLDQESYVYDENGELQGPYTIRELMKESKVSAIFEDSLELNLGDTSVAWSEDMLESWTDYLGYDAIAYLPALINSGEFTNSENESFASDLNTDYANLKEELFNDKHCQVISEWSTAIDMTLDSDIAAGYRAYLEKYGLDETGSNYGANAGGGYRFQSGSDDFQKSLDVDIVEGDNSSFNGDAIRRMDGTVAIKDENGYTSFEALTLTMNDTVFYGGIYGLNYCFSNGINRVVLHGTPYSQPFNGAGMMSMNQWPGWTFMNYGCYDARQAYFNDLYNEDGSVNEDADVYNWTYYITRIQGLLQNTDEQMDFLVVSNDTDTFSRELLDQGYHYSLTSEFGILYDSAVTDPENIVDGVMSAGRHNIKAIVLKNLTEVQNPEVLDRLADYAEKGLTILCLNSDVASVSGTEGTKGESYTDESVAEKWAELCAYENVISITTPEEVADYVESSIRYDVRSETTGSLESGWVEAKELKDSSAGVDYYYFWNGATTCYTTTESQGGFPGMQEETEAAEEKDYYGLDAFDRVYGEGGYGEMLGFEGVSQDVTVTVNATEASIPYLLDPTTGEIRKVAAYTVNEDGTMTLDLNIAGFDCAILAVSEDDALVNNAEVLYDRTENDSIDLTVASYDLTVYSYTNGHEDNTDWISDDATTVTEINMSIDGLKLWDEIEGLEEVSGYAYYSTSFDYAPEGSDGAYLYYEHKANDTARCQDMITEVKVTNSDGEETVFSSIPQLSERVDLGAALSEGENTIRVKLVTTLAAAKAANGDFLCVSENQNYGLTGLKVVSYVNDVTE